MRRAVIFAKFGATERSTVICDYKSRMLKRPVWDSAVSRLLSASGKAIYAIDAFPDDAQLWRIDWIGGVAYNASVPSEPLIDVCLARLPKGERNPLSPSIEINVNGLSIVINSRNSNHFNSLHSGNL
jgi:hypothetical protein